MNKSSELEQLKELIETFPDKFSIDEVEEANKIARTRYDVLDNHVLPYLANKLKKGNLTLDFVSCLETCHTFHSILFENIISINGQFRNRNHSGNDKLYFGGQKHNELRSRFTGSQPDEIISDLKEVFKYLNESEIDSQIDNSLKFYQKFVYTHPFYDGNGRVARLFVNLYLYKHKLFIDWKNLQSKGNFLRKLNNYHESGLDRHFNWWAKVCKKFIYEISDEDQRE